MLKRWRHLPHAGVGFLGLALLLTLTLNADASSRSSHGVMFGGTAAEVKASSSSPAVVTPPNVSEFSSAGSGTVNFNAGAVTCGMVGLTCNTGDFCQCLTITGNVTDGQGPFYTGSFIFYLSVDLSNLYNDGNNVGKFCFYGTGVLSETPGSGATANFITAGEACNGIDNASALYQGGFTIGPSTGGFDEAIGSGIIGLGTNLSSKVGVFDLKGAAANIN